MKNIKRASLVLFIILYSVFILIGCPTPFSPSSLDMKSDIPFAAGAGMGTFSLSIAGSQTQSRTIMPDTGIDQFVLYRLIFSRDGQDDIQPDDRAFEDLGLPVQLPSGTGYTLKVLAYTSTENRNAGKPAASGEKTNFTIKAGQDVSEKITLTPIGVTSSGMGIFCWKIEFTQDLYTGGVLDLSEVKIKIEPVAGASGTENEYVLTAADPSMGQKLFTDTLSLASGYYRVIIELSRTNMRTVIWRETLHVYDTMTSSYSYTFTNDHFVRQSFNVMFNNNDGTSPQTHTYFYNHFENSANIPVPGNCADRFVRFEGWYMNQACTAGNEWNFKLDGPTTLYAKWVPFLDTSFNTEQTIFNSYNLINPGEDFVPVYGWWTQKINGRWLLGEMRETTESRIVETPVITKTYTNTVLGTNGNSTFPMINSPGLLPGGIGTYAARWTQVESRRHNTATAFASTFKTSCYYFIFNITIPNNGVSVHVEAVTSANETPLMINLTGTSTTAQRANLRTYLNVASTVNSTALIDRPLPLTYNGTAITVLNKPGFETSGTVALNTTANNHLNNILNNEITVPAGYTAPGWIILTPHDSGPQRKFVIKVEASSPWYYVSEHFENYPYAIFEQGEAGIFSHIYYWRDDNNKCHWIFDDQPIQILSFEPKNHGQPGTIEIRAFNLTAGVKWKDKPAGMEIDTETMDVQMPEITEAHYLDGGIQQDLFIVSENNKIKVGTVKVEITGHTQTGATLEIVDIKATYVLDSDFINYAGSMTVNNVSVSIDSQTRTGTVNFSGLNNGQIYLNTVFKR